MWTRPTKLTGYNITARLALAGLVLLSSFAVWAFEKEAGQARETAAVIQRDALVAFFGGE